MKINWLLHFIFLVLFIMSGCTLSENASPEPASSEKTAETEKEPQNSKQQEKQQEEPKKETQKETEQEPKQKEKEPAEITIKAVGDVLIHERVYLDAKTAEGYDFNPMLKEVSAYLKSAEITMANQETMIGGEEIGLSTYPSFNSPKAVGDALKNAGVDLVTLANNHTLDRGETAIQSAISHWRELGIKYTGAYSSQEDSEQIRVIETEEGISTAFLSYTYGTNGIPVPEGKPYLVNLMDMEKIASDIEKAKQLADAVIVSYHAGNEYEPLPNQEQKDLAQLAADHGADAVIGHHPHVLQPAEWLEGKDGEKTFVIYSLGNFLSGQDEFTNQIGGVVSFKLEETEAGEVDVTDPAFLITFVAFENRQNYRVLPMHELASPKIVNAYEATKAHMTQWMPELTIVEE